MMSDATKFKPKKSEPEGGSPHDRTMWRKTDSCLTVESSIDYVPIYSLVHCEYHEPYNVTRACVCGIFFNHYDACRWGDLSEYACGNQGLGLSHKNYTTETKIDRLRYPCQSVYTCNLLRLQLPR